MANRRTLYGLVNIDGTSNENGFTSRKVNTGEYLIDFNRQFGRQPALVATLQGDKFKSGASDNVIMVDANTGNASVRIADLPDGGPQDNSFFFICTGR